MKLDPLLRSREPWLHILSASESDTCDALWAIERSTQGKAVCRVVRGRKATSESAFFDECAAAWQFPYYFGENWDAVDECLADLAWLPAETYLFCVTQGIHLLEKESHEQQQRLLKVLQRVANGGKQPTAEAAAKAFHVLLQCTAKEHRPLEQRLQAAGVPFDVLS